MTSVLKHRFPHVHQRRKSVMSTGERIRQAQTQSVNQRTVAVTLPVAPWNNGESETSSERKEKR